MSPSSSDPRLDDAEVPPAVALPSEAEVAGRFWDLVRLFALRRLRNAASAEDVAQEVLRRVVEAIRADRIRNPGALPGFVFQTAQHVILQQYRGAGREQRALQRLQSAEAETAAPGDFLSSLITEERRQLVRNALARVAAEDRELLVALYQEHVEPEDLARRLGVTPGALRVRKHRALKRLAELLGEPGGNK